MAEEEEEDEGKEEEGREEVEEEAEEEELAGKKAQRRWASGLSQELQSSRATPHLRESNGPSGQLGTDEAERGWQPSKRLRTRPFQSGVKGPIRSRRQ